MNIAKLKQHPQVFTRLFGISPDKFDNLVERVSSLWAHAEAKRLRHPRKIKKGGGRPYALTLEENVAMTPALMLPMYSLARYLTSMTAPSADTLPECAHQ